MPYGLCEFCDEPWIAIRTDGDPWSRLFRCRVHCDADSDGVRRLANNWMRTSEHTTEYLLRLQRADLRAHRRRRLDGQPYGSPKAVPRG